MDICIVHFCKKLKNGLNIPTVYRCSTVKGIIDCLSAISK